jgi:hypothetical protein
LVCFNFVNEHAVTDIPCPDAPDPRPGAETLDVIELLTETTYPRDTSKLRTQGLHVILHEYEIQVFSD